MRRKIWTLLLATAMVTLSACGGGGSSTATTAPGASSGAQQLKQVTLTLNWYPYGEHAALYYGVKQGIYKKHGIDLTINAGQGSTKTIQAVGGGQSDFGWADTPALMSGVSGGLPVKSVGVFLQTTPASIQYFEDKGFKSPQDLKGKTIAGTAGDALAATFPAFLEANGMTPADVKVQNVDAAGKLAAVIQGQADGLMGFATDQGPIIAEKSGKKVVAMKFADHGVQFFSNGLVANDKLIKSDPALVKAMVQATSESFVAAQKDTKGAVDSMSGVSPQLPSAKVLTEQFTETLKLLHTKQNANGLPGHNLEADWQATIDTFAKAGTLKNPGKPATYWDPQFAPKG